MRVARVEPLTTARALRGPFDYLLPEGFGGVTAGAVLEVPFGRRRVVGVVVEVADSSDFPEDRLLEPVRQLGQGTTPELVEIALEVADQYCSTPARALGLVLPPGTGVGGRRVKERTERTCQLTTEGSRALEEGARLGAKQRVALEILGGGPMSTARLAGEAGVSSSTVKRLAERGLVEIGERQVRREPEHREVGSESDGPPPLTEAQAGALGTIERALESPGEGEPATYLLAGVTGSGKTEVYPGADEHAHSPRRSAIVLVPEIGLTPQAVSRFRARLGDTVAVLHSGLTAGQRHDEWERLRLGEATVCVGPRSAVFAPLEDLGLIVVDEEHDPSYKQESDPRYDARRVAEMRAHRNGAVLVMGTATPRPETWLSAERLELPDRVDGLGMPPVEVVDMRDAPPGTGALHPSTIDALATVRERGEKAIVMINRRGFSPWLTCRTCGHHWGCPNCDVSLIVHRDPDVLVCHHCAHREPVPPSCPECSGTTLARSGAGTERIELELRELMAPMEVFRLDADTGASGAHGEILERFDRSPSAILVGTQMVAKGHDFPEVTLSVVLDADATLRFPDFRAEERTFSLVTQLAGRSGRGPAGGRVIVQTLAPGAPAIARASSHDSPGFLEGELERRKALDYPPYSDLIRLVFACEDQTRVSALADRAAGEIGDRLPPGSVLLGPAPMFRARGRYRMRILVKTDDRSVAVPAVREVVEELGSEGALRGVVLSVDVDPQ
ncbi:MAG: primosomal protein N' [Solirubrobacterales bacterium]